MSTQRVLLAPSYLPTLRYENILYFIIVAHIIVWTLVPYLVRYNLPQDAIEASMWGQHFEWGYDKNPFMNAWLSALANQLDHRAGWGNYFFSQLSVGLCFISIWTLGKKILPPLYALLGVLLLEGVQYYSLHAIDFNDNTLELSLWALTLLSFYNALQYERSKDWVLVGSFAALSMMTKYFTIMLLVPMLIFILSDSHRRRVFRTAKPYIAILVFVALITPHLVWLTQHEFITLQYAFTRVAREPGVSYFSYAFLFFRRQLETFVPALLLASVLLTGKKPRLLAPRLTITAFDRAFLLYCGLGPYLLTVATAAVTGIQLRAGWGAPLLSLWGIGLMAWVQPRLTTARFTAFLFALGGLMIATLMGYTLAIIKTNVATSANFPGTKLAHVITHEWHQTFHVPLTYVAGSRWIAGNMAYYSLDHPTVFVNWDTHKSPWISEADLKTQGAVFLWEVKKNEKLTPALAQRFASLGPVKILHFPWYRTGHLAPIEIGVAFLPPQMTLIKG